MSEIICIMVLLLALVSGAVIIASLAAAGVAYCFSEVGRQTLSDLRPLRFGWRAGEFALAVVWG